MNEMMFYDLKETPGLPHSLSAQIAREIGRRIVAGSYGPGELIEDEQALAQRYQVSRSVVRDAAKILVGKGLLEGRRGIGTRVRERFNWGLLDDDVLAWHQSAPPSADFLHQLMELRAAIEPKAARWAAQRGSKEQHAEIEAAQLRMEQEQGSVEAFVIADALFHRSILRAASNDLLRAMEGMIFSALLGSIRLTNSDPRENQDSIPFHRAVMAAVLGRKGELAEVAMDRLLADARQRLSLAGSGRLAGQAAAQ